MIEALFLLGWTLLCVGMSAFFWFKIGRHGKVYLLFFLNFIYLSGVFLLYPRVRAAVEFFRAHLA